jgi:hypothetical protein
MGYQLCDRTSVGVLTRGKNRVSDEAKFSWGANQIILLVWPGRQFWSCDRISVPVQAQFCCRKLEFRARLNFRGAPQSIPVGDGSIASAQT